MTTLTSLLVPCEFDPTLWTDAALGQIVHRAAQCLYERDSQGATDALAELPNELLSDVDTARLICQLWMLNQNQNSSSALTLYENNCAVVDPSQPLGAYVHYQGSIALVAAARHEEALDALAVSEYTFREYDEYVALALTYGVVGGILEDLGDARASLQYKINCCDLLAAHGTDRQIVRSTFNLVLAFVQIGRYDDGLTLAHQLYQRLTDSTNPAEWSLIYGLLEQCSQSCDRFEEALEWNTLHSELARQHQQQQLVIGLDVDRAYLYTRLRRYDEVGQILSRLPDVSSIEYGQHKLRHAYVCGQYAQAQGDLSAALRAYTDAITFCERMDVSHVVRLEIMEDILDLTRTEDGRPRADFATAYIAQLKQRIREIDRTSSDVIDSHGRYAARLAQYQREREELLYTTILEASEQTRREVSVSIHDGAGQELAVIGLQLDAALHELSSNDAAREFVSQARERVTFTARELRTLSHALGTHDLERDGLPTAVYNLGSDVRSTSRINVSCYVDEQLNAIPFELARSVYRTVQTLVNNALRHAFATGIEIAITADSDLITVRVSDDGVGLRDGSEQHGMGWKSVRARTELRGGTFTVTSQPNQGTVATATFGYSGNA
jgi:signal transduction histidine kinase